MVIRKMGMNVIVLGKLGHTREPGKCSFRFLAPQSRKTYHKEIRINVEQENPPNFGVTLFDLSNEERL